MLLGSPRAARQGAARSRAEADIAVIHDTITRILREVRQPSESKSGYPYQLEHFVEIPALRTESKTRPPVELPERGVLLLRAFFILQSWRVPVEYQCEQMQTFQHLEPPAFIDLWKWARFKSLEATGVEMYLKRLPPQEGGLTFEEQFQIWSAQWPGRDLPHGQTSMEVFVFREYVLFGSEPGSAMEFGLWKAWFSRLQMLVGLNRCQRWQRMVLDSFVGLSEVLGALSAAEMTAEWRSASEEFRRFADSITITIAIAPDVADQKAN